MGLPQRAGQLKRLRRGSPFGLRRDRNGTCQAQVRGVVRGRVLLWGWLPLAKAREASRLSEGIDVNAGYGIW